MLSNLNPCRTSRKNRLFPGMYQGMILAILCVLLMGADQTKKEKDGWVNLFDGKTLSGWTTLDKKPVPEGGWVMEEGGVLHRAYRAEDIYTEKEYANFVLEFEWKIAPRANSGVKYRMTWYGENYLGPEYQVIDDRPSPQSAKKENRGRSEAAALYELYAPNDKKKLNPVGEWNTAKIVADGVRIEHWLNGEKIVEADTSSEDFQKAVAASKFAEHPNFARNPSGRIMLQEHGGEVWYRNMRIKTLP